ncbi:MAG: DUF2207 domain-containing protein [Saprospiraceae bacterium]|nr:DUF2207 domain-containing protein [Saprospiraceae bacterium]MCB9320387.1 DUF2207 domain-containing protein [Lewinellaceae bacterium]
MEGFPMSRRLFSRQWPRMVTAVLLVLSGLSSVFSQTEKIFSYDVQIDIHTDRSIVVTEYIDVYVNGDKIQRGITRSLPPRRNLNGHSMRMHYKILKVEKDHQPEPYHTSSGENGLMLYLGQQDVFLDPGRYLYMIQYEVDDQIGFFEDYDELYWNAVGNDVEFPVEQASCRIYLPQGTNMIQQAAYTGGYGIQQQDYTFNDDGTALDFRLTRGLNPTEGFTVAVGFTKGIVDQPGILNRIGTLLLIILGSIFLLPYYVYTWWKYGQDPPTPASYPLWDSPNKLSAASVGYIRKEKHDSKSFTASVIHLAVKGYLRIEEVEESGFFSKSKHFDLIKIKNDDGSLPGEEATILRDLFALEDRVSIRKKYNPIVEETFQSHRGSLVAQHRTFIREGNNLKFLAIPILSTIGIFGLGIILLINSAYATPANITALVAFGIISFIALLVYGYLIKKPTPAKLDLQSRIDGFKMYLELAEKDRLALLNPPDMTPDHFEACLPYAFALGVEHSWSEKFKTILEQANYHPQWNNSPSTIYFADHFGQDFSQSVASAATKPSDSGSGSGGGGFSGGGGGGGGVGGW